jgi:nicotinamidase-related amidase
MTRALLIIDIQNDYFAGGKMQLVGAEQAGQNAAAILASFRASGDTVIHVQHVAKSPTATFFLPDTDGVEIHSSVAPANGEPVVVKHFPNAFRQTNLGDILHGLKPTELVVVGMMTHMCVDTTVRAANDLGFNATLVGDACATLDLTHDGATAAAAEVQTAYLAAIDGSFATVLNAANYLSAAN